MDGLGIMGPWMSCEVERRDERVTALVEDNVRSELTAQDAGSRPRPQCGDH
jgi:hypothetical protein